MRGPGRTAWARDTDTVQIMAEGAAMGAPAQAGGFGGSYPRASQCPYCGAVREDAGDERPLSAGQALEGLYHQVELIRKMAETSSRQSDEIRLLRETIARLRGTTLPEGQSQAKAS